MSLRLLAISGFVLAGVLVVVVEWASRREGSRIPSLGDVAAIVMSHEVAGIPVGRIAVFGFWWWIGWHFLAR